MHDYMKTIISAIKSWVNENIKKSTADWNQNDKDSIDYIKNKPFGDNSDGTITKMSGKYVEGMGWSDGFITTEQVVCLTEEITIEADSENYTSDTYIGFIPEIGTTYTVIWDGVEYKCLCSNINSYDDRLLGNPAIYGDNETGMEDATKPFAIYTFNDGSEYGIISSESGTHTISIIGKKIDTSEVIHHIDSKYIKDMYREYFTEKVFIDNKTFDFSNQNYTNFITSNTLSGKRTYNVIFDGTTYKDVECIEYYSTFIGDEYFTKYPFYIRDDFGSFRIYVQDNMPHTISLIEREQHIVTIDRKYVEGIAGENVTGRTFIIDDEDVVANEGAEIFNDYENNIATGSCSHAEGHYTKATGHCSHAEGHGAEAEGENSHAEGRNTSAIGEFSHAEGLGTYALGSSAHAEGEGATALEYSSHAEGIHTIANNCSHAEGVGGTTEGGVHGSRASICLTGDAGSKQYSIDSIWNGSDTNIRAGHYVGYGQNICKITYVDGNSITLDKTLSSSDDLSNDSCALYITGIANNMSHSEGDRTVAIGSASHSEGRGTRAYGDQQHVQGRYNLGDESSTYAHIVGNGNFERTDMGTYKITRSNAHTLDWEGNAWFSGDVYVGSTSGINRDEGSKRLATVYDLNLAKDGIVLKDTDNGCNYVIQMKNGNLISLCACHHIEVTVMPTKTEYVQGEKFDADGMIITAIAGDGTKKVIEDYTFQEYVISTNGVNVQYVEAGIIYDVNVPLTVIPFDAVTTLIDFNYTTNDDGTYTITSWKGTLNGEPSTEMIVPNNSKIII